MRSIDFLTRPFTWFPTLSLVAILAVAPNAIAVPDNDFNPPNYRQEALPRELDTARAWEIVGRNAAATGDYQNAIVAFDKAIDLSRRRQPQLYEQRGWAHYLHGEPRSAIADLETAAQLYTRRERLQRSANARQMQEFVRDRLVEGSPSPDLAIRR
ncbi:hypothetical protein CKA32_006133 [Geitlerinema sp. FC II]|nr:hypothetical protein CKA32_006133 [Geitlerinema sp. FC II]